jgi:cell division protein ZapA (FtsZ GTPase activity inhibitor)
MAEKIKVVIKGQEYVLRGENESAIRLAAEDVDTEIKDLQSAHFNQTQETLAVLAALNIAEKRYLTEKQKKIDENYLVNEMDKIAKSLVDIVQKHEES